MNIQNNLTIPIKTLKQASEIIGGYTVTSKMPTISYSISAKDCKTGSKLRKIKNSVCSDCYALKGNYVRYAKNIEKAQNKRLKAIFSKDWTNAMIYIMNHQKQVIKSGLFRWHDSGDIQSMEHLQKIVDIATATPNIKHWLPTKESNLVKSLGGVYPSNLIIRLSGSMVDGKAPNFKHTSTVTTDITKVNCFASLPSTDSRWHDGCGECRNCWDSSIQDIAYYKH